MKILDYETFWTTVDPLLKFDLDEMGITPDTDLGFFLKKRFDELVEYCKKNPNCHVISMWRGIKINTAIPNARSYMLGAGDPTPDLVWIRKYRKDHILAINLLKF